MNVVKMKVAEEDLFKDVPKISGQMPGEVMVGSMTSKLSADQLTTMTHTTQRLLHDWKYTISSVGQSFCTRDAVWYQLTPPLVHAHDWPVYILYYPVLLSDGIADRRRRAPQHSTTTAPVVASVVTAAEAEMDTTGMARATTTPAASPACATCTSSAIALPALAAAATAAAAAALNASKTDLHQQALAAQYAAAHAVAHPLATYPSSSSLTTLVTHASQSPFVAQSSP